MASRLIAILAIIVALCLAVLAVALPVDSMHAVIFVAKFFDVMLPVLAVGALLKYLLKDAWQ